MSTKLKSKLTLAQDQILEAYRNGATLREIAEVHGVSSGTVRNKLIELGADLRKRGRRRKEDEKQSALPTLPVADPTPAFEGE
jgi:transposase-like protein